MDEVNERIKKKLDSEEWEKKKPKFDYNFSIDTLEGRSRKSNRPKSGSKPGREAGGRSWSFDTKKNTKKQKERSESEAPDPLVDLFESEEGIRVVAMFPGANNLEDLEIAIEDERIVLTTEEQKRELDLPFPVEDKPEVRFQNGIFDIHLEKRNK